MQIVKSQSLMYVFNIVLKNGIGLESRTPRNVDAPLGILGYSATSIIGYPAPGLSPAQQMYMCAGVAVAFSGCGDC